MIKKLIAIDLLKEELDDLESTNIPSNSYKQTRIQNLKEALQELNYIALKSDCISCRYNNGQEELSELCEEEYLIAFDKCRTCSNYYTNNFEAK